jgi:hypothetical protein
VAWRSSATGSNEPTQGDVLYVADSGTTVCTGDLRECEKSTAAGGLGASLDVYLANLEASNGKIIAFDIMGDGSLSNRREIVSGLPVADLEHGIDTVALGPDGRLYVSVGNLGDTASVEPGVLASIERADLHLLGTIISMEPDGSDLQVVASGLRNVYDLAFGSDGDLYVVDNDGPTQRGFRHDEVIHVEPGADYGFPEQGSFAPAESRSGWPIWLLSSILGTAGTEWGENVGLGPGLVFGSYGGLHYLAFSEDEGGYYVASPASLTLLLSPQAYVTGLQATTDGRLIALTYGSFLSLQDELLILEVQSEAFPPVR